MVTQRMQAMSMCSDSNSSWVCIGLYKPRIRGRCSGEELAARILSVSLSFNSTAGVPVKTAILKSFTSNHVAVFSIWEKGHILDEPYEHQKALPRKLLNNVRARVLRRSQSRSAYSRVPPLLHAAEFQNALSGVAHLVDLSWYEVQCWDCRDKTLLSQSSVPTCVNASKGQPVSSLMAPLSSTPSSTTSGSLLCWDSPEKKPSPLASSLSLPSLGLDGDEKLSPSTWQCLSPASSPTSRSRPSLLHVCVGDVVHLRRIISSKSCLKDVLSYSCLAILKAYFPHTEGLHTYSFYRSLDGSRMAAMGVWQSLDTATNFLHAPDGAREERFWSSLGAVTRLGIFEVVALVN